MRERWLALNKGYRQAGKEYREIHFNSIQVHSSAKQNNAHVSFSENYTSNMASRASLDRCLFYLVGLETS